MKFNGQFLWRGIWSKPHEEHFLILKEFDESFIGEAQCFIDVGANRGQTIQSVSFFIDCFIESFEPDVKTFLSLFKRMGKNKKFRIHNVALSDKKGTMNLYTPIYKGIRFDGLASFDPGSFDDFFNKRNFFSIDKSRLIIDRSEVDVRTLDSFGLSAFVIKIDVQGHELSVLRGAEETIRNNLPIIFIERPDLNAEVQFLAEFGYEAFVYKDGRLLESASGYNVIFINKHHKNGLLNRFF